MNEPRWTQQQLDAINQRNKFTLLSRAAGSGKTTVLVERVTKLIKEGFDPENLLIVTFSRASAAEFRKRIADSLDRSINLTPKKSDERQKLLSRRMKLNNADISTINSFCMKLAKENFSVLGIPSDSSVCDEVQRSKLHEKAIDEAMNYGYSLDSFNSLVSCFGKSSSDIEIRHFLLKMNNFFSALADPEKEAEIMRKQYTSYDDMKLSPSFNWMMDSIRLRADYIFFVANRIRYINNISGSNTYDTCISESIQFASQLKTAAASNDIQKIKELLTIDYAPKKLPALKRGTKTSEIEIIQKLYNDNLNFESKNNHSGKLVKDILKDVAFLDEDSYTKNNKVTAEYIDALFSVYSVYQSNLMNLKIKGKYFEFGDYEHFAVKLLCNDDGSATELCKSLREHYSFIMEDEYQDTSRVQDKIFCMLAKEDLSNLFVVGDVKQSIYRFRKATPEIFFEKKKLREDNPDKFSTLYLSNNFRSRREILRDINYIFSKIMTINAGGIEYNKNELLFPPERDTPVDDITPYTQLILSDDNESEIIADKISDMIKSGVVIKSKNDGIRPIRAGDFCILLRNKTNFSEYKNAIESKGAKAFVRDEEPRLNRPEVQTIINLLRIIANPMQEVYLTASMFGDIFGFSLDEIMQIKSIDKYKNLYKTLKESDNPKAKEMLHVLQEITFNSDILSPDKLIDFICRSTGYYRRISFSENGAEKRENIRWFISFAKNWAKNHNQDLSRFLRWTDMYAEANKTQSSEMSKADNSVTIMTIHASKGLEFPVVFVSGLQTEFNRTDGRENLLFDAKLGVGIVARKSFGRNVSTLQTKAIQDKMIKDSVDDEIRLLYVAMTRAEQYLFLTARKRGNQKIETVLSDNILLCGGGIHDYFTISGKSYLKWIVGALAQTEFAKSNYPFVEPDTSLFRQNISITYQEAHFTDAPDNPIAYAVSSEENNRENTFSEEEPMIQEIRKGFGFVYHNTVKTLLPVKMSVSQISKSGDIEIQVPQFTKTGLGNRQEKGTAMHRFAQHCDILRARENLDAEINRLRDAGLVSDNLLNREILGKFIYSKLSDMILSAEKVHRERNFRTPVSSELAMRNDELAGGEILVQGVMDCVLENGDEITIIDYKTDNITDISELSERYSEQLNLYRLGASALFGTDKIRCILYSFKLDEFIYV